MREHRTQHLPLKSQTLNALSRHMGTELLLQHTVALFCNQPTMSYISESHLYSRLCDRGVAIKSPLISAMPGTFGRSNGETDHKGLHFSRSCGRIKEATRSASGAPVWRPLPPCSLCLILAPCACSKSGLKVERVFYCLRTNI